MLTNFNTIQTRIKRLKALEQMEADGTFSVLPKKEVAKLMHEKSKLDKNLGGIKEMKRVPDVIFIVDPRKERIAMQEARVLGIPIVSIVDTNCDPEEVDYVIPGNDDAIRAVKLIAGKIADAVIESRQGQQFVTSAERAADTEVKPYEEEKANEETKADEEIKVDEVVKAVAVEEVKTEEEVKAYEEVKAE